jgi:ATP-dependent DNA helicase RecQ
MDERRRPGMRDPRARPDAFGDAHADALFDPPPAALPTSRPVRAGSDAAHDLPARARAVLAEVFGYRSFRGLQEDVVNHVGAGGDALVLMPTGGGKSLCYQVPAILRHRAGLGVTVVVSPLIALMQDQVGALEEAGVHAAFLNSTQDFDQAMWTEGEAKSGRLVLLYVAPERLVTPRMLAMFDAMHAAGRLALFAIDEAHCVSQWGHDFREDYLALSLLHERYAGVPRIALTATADAETRRDIVERLELRAARRFVASFDRPNIRYTIVDKTDAKAQLLAFVREHHAGGVPGDVSGDAAAGAESGIVYCATRKKVDETAQWLCTQGIAALPYHAGLDSRVRQRHQDRFLREDGLVMVATIAFGMGIDKPDVRFVAHLDLPKSIEGYYQETGRAGRDGEHADAWMCYGLADVVNQRRMIDEGAADEAFKKLQRRKLEALLALAETHDCRRARLLAYFGEAPGVAVCAGTQGPRRDAACDSDAAAEVDHASAPAPRPWRCMNCDNCLAPPRTWDATEAARKLLSCIARIRQASGLTFGAQHLFDVLRGKASDKVRHHGHERLSTWGIGADLDEPRWRAVLRQLVALGHVVPLGEYNTLGLGPDARAVLRGDVPILLREPADKPPRRAKSTAKNTKVPGAAAAPAQGLDDRERARFEALRAWRAEVAREHGLPAYVIFHDATLATMAREQPATLDALAGISGVGAKKLEAYGADILGVLARQA